MTKKFPKPTAQGPLLSKHPSGCSKVLPASSARRILTPRPHHRPRQPPTATVRAFGVKEEAGSGQRAPRQLKLWDRYPSTGVRGFAGASCGT